MSGEAFLTAIAGLEKERAEIRMDIEDSIDKINVVVTTYDLASKKVDSKFLRHLKPVVSSLHFK